jgi:hypothetical protein
MNHPPNYFRCSKDKMQVFQITLTHLLRVRSKIILDEMPWKVPTHTVDNRNVVQYIYIASFILCK